LGTLGVVGGGAVGEEGDWAIQRTQTGEADNNNKKQRGRKEKREIVGKEKEIGSTALRVLIHLSIYRIMKQHTNNAG